MARRLALGDAAGAHGAQNRAMAFTVALAAPFFVAFLMIPELIMAALFMRGAFTADSASAAGAALAAYGVGLPAVVLIRSAVASFHARQDTTTPLIASFSGIGVNLALKFVLYEPFGAPGLAFATAIGAWVNVILLVVLARRRDYMAPDRDLMRTVAAVAGCAALLAAVTFVAGPLVRRWAAGFGGWAPLAHLGALGTLGAVVYFGALLALVRVLRLPFRRA
jgi:putative peptidoglycan lipid II flippase